EYVAEVNPDLCTGCRSCVEVCQFDALSFNPADRKIEVDLSACYGCGVCRSVCPKDAIQLRQRADVPEVANLW
ncbi:MAG: 4Fe-4S binding protein, partial [Armatimonadota bacterium]